MTTSELELNQLNNVFCACIQVLLQPTLWGARKTEREDKKKKCSFIMMQLQVLVMVLLKLSWFNRLEIVWVSLYVCHCFLFDLKWENVSSNGILHFVSEETALKTLSSFSACTITVLSWWYYRSSLLLKELNFKRVLIFVEKYSIWWQCCKFDS